MYHVYGTYIMNKNICLFFLIFIQLKKFRQIRVIQFFGINKAYLQWSGKNLVEVIPPPLSDVDNEPLYYRLYTRLLAPRTSPSRIGVYQVRVTYCIPPVDYVALIYYSGGDST